MAKCTKDITTKESSCLNNSSTQPMLQKALWRQLWPWFWTAPKSQPWDFNLRSLSSLVKSEMSDVDEIRICQRCQNCELLRFAKRRDLPPLILSVQATLLMESSCFHAWHKREFKCLKFNAPSCRPCAKNESMSNSFGWTPGIVTMTTHGSPQSMPGVTLRLDPLEPGKVPQNSVESMNWSWVKELIGVQIMGIKKYETLTHRFQYMLHVWQRSRPLEWPNQILHLTRTTVEMLAAQPKEQRCLAANGSYSFCTHPNCFYSKRISDDTWHPPVRANVLLNSQNDSAATDPHSPRGLGSREAGKAVTRSEQNHCHKAASCTNQRPVWRWFCQTSRLQSKQKGFRSKLRSRKIQHSPFCFVVWWLTVT